MPPRPQGPPLHTLREVQASSQPDRQCIHLGIQAHAARVPEATAILAPGRAPLTYGDLGRQIDELAATLNRLGVGRQDRVALVLPSGPEMALALIAVATAATCAPFNPVLRADELDFHLSTLNLEAVIVPAAMDGPIRAVAQRRHLRVLELLPAPAGGAGGFSLSGPEHPPAPRANVARPDDVAFLLPTSGTTSRARTVPLTHANICASARNIRRALALGEEDRCLDVMPLFHVHGLMATLASLLAGASVVTPPEFDVTRFFDWLEECRPTWYTAVPAIHQAVLDSAAFHADVIAGRPLRFIRSSSAALPPSLGAELERVFQAPVIESYGMTEAAHQITSVPWPPAARRRGSVGVAAGPDVAIIDEAGRLLRAGETGEIVVRGPQVMRGCYEGAPATGPDAVTEGWLRTGDQGYLDADGFLFITGRLKEIINRGGEKISPREIDDVLLEHPAVAQAVTFAVPHPTLGEDVMAAVVLRAPAAEALLRRFAAERLAPFKVPGRVMIVDDLPRGATGKVGRRAVAEALGLRTRPEVAAGIAPRTPTEAVVASIWGQVLGVAEVAADDNFFALGGDSIRAALIVSRLREALDVEVPLRSCFETPTVAGVAERIEEVRRQARARPSVPLSPVPRTENLALSFAQQRLWFLDQLEPGGAEYNRAAVLRIAGRLDVRALEQSLGEIRRRHEALRTTFPAVAGEPAAVIAAAERFELAVVDLRELPEAEREARAGRLGADEARRPFDLARGPLFRATLLRPGEEDWILLLTMHHIVSDGWSTGVLHRELALLYQAFSSGTPSPLPEPPIQHVDYASWQRRWLQGEIMDVHLAYWTRQLAGSPARLDLPVDRRRASAARSRGAGQPFVLPAALAQALRALGGRERATLFMTLLAAFGTLLHRYTGQDDIVVGSPVAGRSRVETEGLIGFFANTLALRTDLSGDPTFRELLGRVREMALGAYAHQELPFDTLVAALEPERGPDHTPLFHVMFALQNAPASAPALPGLTVRVLETASGPAKFDLTVSIRDLEGDLPGSVEYDPDLFDAATIARMIGHFQTMLEAIVADPDERISRLPLVTEAERQQLLVDGNDTRAEYLREACLPELFEAQVARTPESVAIVAGDERVSYQELNRRANELAHRLRRLGVGPEVRVAICAERSIAAVVGLLGILKAGGAYVPLDPAHPKERLRFMLADAGVALVLTQEWLVDRLPVGPETVLCLDAERDSVAGESSENPADVATADNLAYVIYTSGSTGTPKGVAIPHRAVNRLVSNTNYLTVRPSDIVAQASNYSFDAVTFEVWGALLNGARLVVVDPDVVLSPPNLAAAIDGQGISVLFLTTAVFNEVARQVPTAFKRLRYLLTGGEAVDPACVAAVLRHGAPEHLLHVYGPTETTTFASWYRVHAVAAGAHTIPIGRPITNTELYVLDRHRNPVPVGIPGELHIGGPGLARGYLHRPELTAEKFIPHPFSAEPDARLYKTGDLARYLADGNIEFLGRVDGQVKIRGCRVEPGEIEARLNQHPAVEQTVVVAREDVPGDKRLVAYVVATRGQHAATATELRGFLRQTLPAYMMPAAFVMLEALPLSPNGKVDRRTLPAPRPSDLSSERAFVAPRTPSEETLARILADVLGLERVGVHDDFFELGGHSLLATRAMSRLREAFGAELPLRLMFETPTVAALAGAIAQATHAEAIPRRPASGPCPLSFAQQRLWFLDQLAPHSAAYNIARAVRLHGALRVEALQQALDALVARHEVLRTTFAAADGAPVQIIADRRVVDMGVIDLTAWPEPERTAELQRRLGHEARRPFDPSRDLMLRATVFRLADSEHALILTTHHIASDGWSMGVLFEEVADLYDTFAHGRPSSLSPLPIQYADYVVWQRQRLSGERLDAELAYWRQRLAGVPTVLELPTDRPRPAVQTFRGARESVLLPGPLTDALGELSRREGVTLFMTLLAGFQILLHRYTGQDDVVVGSPVAGRTRVEVEGLVGFFVNTLVLRTDVSGDPSVREVLGRVRDVALGAYAHQDLPFDKLVEALAPGRDGDRTPLVRVMFALQNAPASALALAGLVVQDLEIASGPAKFELTLALTAEGAGLRATAEYDADLFDAATIARLLGHLHAVLKGIVANPSSRISHVPLLTSAERHRLVGEWSGPRATYPAEACLHHRFETQVARTPQAVAVVCGGARLTYRELNRRANHLAHQLRRLGVGPEVLVGICLEPSLELVIGLLGIAKAGGAYVPLDPRYPRQRLALMLEDAEVRVLVTHERLLDKLRGLAELPVVCLDGGGEPIAGEDAENPSSGVSGENLAYVIYTSGSTGTPKGVLVTHANVSRLFEATHAWFRFDDTDVWTLFHSHAFDFSVWELWGALRYGGRLVVVPYEVSRAPAAFHTLLKDERVTVLNQTPSAFRQLMAADALHEAGDLPALRWIILGGEALELQSLRSWFERHGDERPRLVNMYGTTETTVLSTYRPLRRTDLDGARGSVIGQPMPDVQVYILDAALQPVPIGVRGQLWVGGAGVARGYLRRPGLTAERFIPDPFGTVAGARLYQTGDVARFLADGDIEYLGRIDEQVKIRGFRVELGEVESVIARHLAVREVVVVVRADDRGDTRLVAYIVLDPALASPEDSIAEVKRLAREALPDYMMPSAFVVLATLPLTPNGKVDCRALPAPQHADAAATRAFVAPRTPIEETLARIWAEVLGLERVGVHDNFFELGGHSLLATRLVSRLREAFGADLTLRQIFDIPTVGGLAAAIAQAQAERLDEAEITGMLGALQQLSDEDARRLLRDAES